MASIFKKYGIHLLTSLSLLGRFYGLSVSIFNILYFFIVDSKSRDHASNWFDIFYEFLIELRLPVISVRLLIVQA